MGSEKDQKGKPRSEEEDDQPKASKGIIDWSSTGFADDDRPSTASLFSKGAIAWDDDKKDDPADDDKESDIGASSTDDVESADKVADTAAPAAPPLIPKEPTSKTTDNIGHERSDIQIVARSDEVKEEISISIRDVNPDLVAALVEAKSQDEVIRIIESPFSPNDGLRSAKTESPKVRCIGRGFLLLVASGYLFMIGWLCYQELSTFHNAATSAALDELANLQRDHSMVKMLLMANTCAGVIFLLAAFLFIRGNLLGGQFFSVLGTLFIIGLLYWMIKEARPFLRDLDALFKLLIVFFGALFSTRVRQPMPRT